MDLQQIKTFIDAMAASDLAEMQVCRDGWTLRLTRRASEAASVPPTVVQKPATGAAAVPSAKAAAPAHNDVRAPLYGVVHLQPSPGEQPFAPVGAPVHAGQTLCVIEAMKVFNEVRAERAGTVGAVLVTSGQEVEPGQALLRLA